MKNLGGMKTLALAIVLGALTWFLTTRYVQQVSQKPVETAPVVVATAPIAARTPITADMLRVQQMPVEAVHPEAARTPGDLVGKVARTALAPGEQVLRSKVFLQRAESGLAFMGPANKRAVSVNFTEVIGFYVMSRIVDIKV